MTYLIYFVCKKIIFIKYCDDKKHAKLLSMERDLGDNCSQNSHLGMYILLYTVGNLVLRQHASGVIKHDFGMYIQRCTSPDENFEYGYPHSNALQ